MQYGVAGRSLVALGDPIAASGVAGERVRDALAWRHPHGEHSYRFQGLRKYKDKFDPVWEPRYLASPGGLALPRVLANVSTLISGGVTGLVAR